MQCRKMSPRRLAIVLILGVFLQVSEQQSGDGGDGSPSSVELTVIVLVAAAVCALVGGILLYLCCSICRIQWDYHKAIKLMKLNIKRENRHHQQSSGGNRPSAQANLSRNYAPGHPKPTALRNVAAAHHQVPFNWIPPTSRRAHMDHTSGPIQLRSPEFAAVRAASQRTNLPVGQLQQPTANHPSNSLVGPSIQETEKCDLHLSIPGPPRYSILFSPCGHTSANVTAPLSSTSGDGNASQFQQPFFIGHPTRDVVEFGQLRSWPQFS